MGNRALTPTRGSDPEPKCLFTVILPANPTIVNFKIHTDLGSSGNYPVASFCPLQCRTNSFMFRNI